MMSPGKLKKTKKQNDLSYGDETRALEMLIKWFTINRMQLANATDIIGINKKYT